MPEDWFSSFLEHPDTKADSREALELTKSTLHIWTGVVAGSTFVFSEWGKINRRIFARTIDRLSEAQEEETFEAQQQKIGEIASENLKDYVESFAKMSHLAAVVSRKVMKVAFEEAKDMDAKTRAREKEIKEKQEGRAVKDSARRPPARARSKKSKD